MKRREVTLALLLVGTLGLALFGKPLLNIVLGPLSARQGELARLNMRLDRLQKLNTFKHQSLAAPSGGSVGRAVEQYQQWVWDLAETVGEFQDVHVSPHRFTSGTTTARSGFVPVQVRLKAVVRLEQLKTFLFHFYRTDLLQRIVSIQLKTDTHDGDPPLELTLVAEGLALPYAVQSVSQRDSLFPRTRLASGADADAKTLSVESAEGFPAAGSFRVRTGSEFLDVTSATDLTWAVSRAGGAGSLDEGTPVELAPVAAEMKDLRLEHYTLVNPFARYRPQLTVVGSKIITLGDPVSLTAKVGGIRVGNATSFQLDSPPEGMTIDRNKGLIAWTPPAEQSLGDVEFVVVARIAGRTTPLKTTTTLQFRAKPVVAKVNRRPVLGDMKSLLAEAGLPVEYTVTATDPEQGKLAFTLGSGAPPGATIDASTGKFRWVPEAPGEFRISIEVSDDGSPARKATGRLTIDVTLDSAQFTVLTASITRDGESIAWLFDRLKNQRIVLKPQTRLRYANVDAVVVAIENRAVVFRVGKTERRLAIGDSLQKLKPVPNEEPGQ